MAYDKKKAAAAFARPGVGQATPGALSGASASKSYPSGSPTASGMTQASPNPIVTIGGQSGQIAPAPIDLNSMTVGFAEKYKQAMEEQLLGVKPQADATGMMAGFDIQNTSNPFAPNFSGTAQNPFAPLMEGEASMQQMQQQVPQERSAIQAWVNQFFAGMPGATFDEYGDPSNGTKLTDFILSTPFIGKAGVGGFGRGVVSKKVLNSGKTVKAVQTFTNWAKNFFTFNRIINYIDPKTGKIIGQEISRNPWTLPVVAGGVITATAIAYSLIKGGKEEQTMVSWGLKEELPQMASMYYNQMIKEGDPKTAKAILTVGRNVGNDVINFSPIPGKTGQEGNQKYLDGWNQIMDMVEIHNDLKVKMGEQGMSDQQSAEFWYAYNDKVQSMITGQETQRVDYFNAQKQISLENELRAREQYAANQKGADANAQEQAAQFWLNYRKELAQMEEEERIKQAKFWLDYRKMILKIQSESGGSRLNFGLLR